MSDSLKEQIDYKKEYEKLRAEIDACNFILDRISEIDRIVTMDGCERAINDLLQKICEYAHADRAYLFERNGYNEYDNTYEWCAEGVVPQIESLQGVPESAMPYWMEVLCSGKSILIEELESVAEIMPDEYELLKDQQVHSLIVMPVITESGLQGFVGVDNPEMEASDIIMRLLSTMGNHLGSKRENLLMYKQLEFQLEHDTLTGALNRRSFYKYATQLLENNPERRFSLLVSDIKSFKMVNEIFGEKTADRMLKDFAAWVTERIGNMSVFGRIHGDRFALMLPEEDVSEQLLDDALAMLRGKYHSENFCVHMYMAVYKVTDIHEPVVRMTDKAFLAIGKIKGDLHSRVVYYGESDMQKELNRQKLISEFNNAIRDGQFCMYLQPQTDNNGVLQGAEALIRWNHPTMGLLMPAEFIDYFEESNLITELDCFMWEKAAKQVRTWMDQGYHYYISINVSVKDFYHIDVYETLLALVEKYEIPANRLHVEITETVLSEDQANTETIIRKLHEKGFIIEIDDFGSGYSSLNFLKDVCADVIKIDRGFLHNTSNEKRGMDILQTIIALSKRIDMNVIAEGVENYGQIQMLNDMGCERFQGYYFSKPIPIAEFEDKYFHG